MVNLSLISFLQSYGWQGKAIHSQKEIDTLLQVYLDESGKADSFPTLTEHAANFFKDYEGLELYSRNSFDNGPHVAVSLSIQSVYGSFDFDVPIDLSLPIDCDPQNSFPLGMYAIVGAMGESNLNLLAQSLSAGEGRWAGNLRVLILTGSGEIYSYGEGLIFKHAHSLLDFFERFQNNNELYKADQKYVYSDNFLAKNE